MSTLIDIPSGKTKREVIDQAVIRFAGDSGDGMQITGSQFTNTVAIYGNDIATFPDFPAEIRAPAGTVPGVSGFQLNFSSGEVYTPGDSVDVLVVMNPAALKVNIADLKKGAFSQIVFGIGASVSHRFLLATPLQSGSRLIVADRKAALPLRTKTPKPWPESKSSFK